MKKLSNYEELGIIIGNFCYLLNKQLASHFNVSSTTISNRLRRFREDGRYDKVMFYLNSAFPHYEDSAEVLFEKDVPSVQYYEGIEKVVEAFGLSKFKIFKAEKEILNFLSKESYRRRKKCEV